MKTIEKIKIIKLRYSEIYQLFINGKYWGLICPDDKEKGYIIRKGDIIQ